MTNNYFRDSELAIQWADENIKKFDSSVINILAKNANPFRLYDDPKTRDKVLRFFWEFPIPASLQRDARGIFQDLRSSLDYLINAVADSKGIEVAKHRFVFPIVKDRKAFDDEIKRRRIVTIDPDLADILLAIQPYGGGNVDFELLRYVNDNEKHCHLSGFGGRQFGGKMEFFNLNGDFSIPKMGRQPLYNGVELLRLSRDTELNAKIDVALNVVFDQIEAIKTESAVAVLNKLFRSVQAARSQIVNRFFS